MLIADDISSTIKHKGAYLDRTPILPRAEYWLVVGGSGGIPGLLSGALGGLNS